MSQVPDYVLRPVGEAAVGVKRPHDPCSTCGHSEWTHYKRSGSRFECMLGGCTCVKYLPDPVFAP